METTYDRTRYETHLLYEEYSLSILGEEKTEDAIREELKRGPKTAILIHQQEGLEQTYAELYRPGILLIHLKPWSGRRTWVVIPHVDSIHELTPAQ